MKYNMKDLKGYTIATKDGPEGKIKDILFDEDSWVIRYFETDFGSVFNSNRILIPVEIVTDAGSSKSRFFRIDLSRADLERYPKPEHYNFVSRSYEEQLSRFYGTSSYWTSVPITRSDSGTAKDIGSSSSYSVPRSIRNENESGPESGILNFNDITDYSIQAIDEKLGHIEDLIVDSSDWHISHVVVDTANWLPWGKKVILSINQIQDISYNTKEARVNLKVDTIKNAPEYDSSRAFDDQYEHSLHDYYNRTYVK
jgi:sporulation protein YlmC with PRC-barrel domain